MTKADLIALAERVERAEGPSFTLELEIFRAINPQATSHSIPNNYTASFDAAITLVPEGWCEGYERNSRFDKPNTTLAWLWPFGSDYDPDWMLGQEGQRDNPDAVYGYAATPSLALTAACLRAIAEEMDG